MDTVKEVTLMGWSEPTIHPNFAEMLKILDSHSARKYFCITAGPRDIVRTKRERGLAYPWINFVFCAMKSNLDELPALVRLAADIGLEKVKAVYITVFDEALLPEFLWGQAGRVRDVFSKAARATDELGIQIKLPHVIGEDEAGSAPHKDHPCINNH